MNRRTVLFGYKYENGNIVIDNPSADIVKEVFCQYLERKSLLEISELLNHLHIEYMPGVVDWNKARIKRILDDKRYLGDSKYPQIIDSDSYAKVNEIKQNRNNQKNTDRHRDIYNLDAVVICPVCGSEMKHRIEKRAKIHERWKCQNSDCRNIISISDVNFFQAICDILNSVITNPSIIQSNIEPQTEPITLLKLENEINRLFDSGNPDKNELKAKIFEAASVKYNELNNYIYEGKKLQTLFRYQQFVKDFPLELFNRIVTTVSFDSDNNVIITLLNGQTIGKELTDGTAEEKSYGHQSDGHCQRGCQEQISAETGRGVLPSIHPARRTNQQL